MQLFDHLANIIICLVPLWRPLDFEGSPQIDSFWKKHKSEKCINVKKIFRNDICIYICIYIYIHIYIIHFIYIHIYIYTYIYLKGYMVKLIIVLFYITPQLVLLSIRNTSAASSHGAEPFELVVRSGALNKLRISCK